MAHALPIAKQLATALEAAYEKGGIRREVARASRTSAKPFPRRVKSAGRGRLHRSGWHPRAQRCFGRRVTT